MFCPPYGILSLPQGCHRSFFLSNGKFYPQPFSVPARLAGAQLVLFSQGPVAYKPI